jgi:hypothetical protein
MDSRMTLLLRLAGSCVLIFSAAGVSSSGQTQSPPAATGNVNDLDARIEKLTESLEQTRAELDQSRDEIRELRSMLEQVLQKENAKVPAAPAASSSTPPNEAGDARLPSPQGSPAPAQISQEDWQILNTRVGELQQDKVESASKYRLKVSGLVLATAFADIGQVDNLDVPTVALPRTPDQSGGSAGGSLRQSIVGLTAIGPHLLGADTAADFQMDFFGGLPSGYGGVSSGIARLRIARAGFAWQNTSIIAGLDTPLFSPNLPSTYLSVAVPAFAAAGNLWTWAPEIRIEHRFTTDSAIWKAEAGLLDAPSYGYVSSSARTPTPGESSRQPTYAVRFSTNGRDIRRPLALGVSGIYFPQLYEGGFKVNGWGVVGDWRISLFSRFEWSGEAFLGKGLDVFGGVPQPMVPTQDPYYYLAAPALAKVTMFGGWSQLKFRLDERSEMNAAFGYGGRMAAGVREVAMIDPELTNLSPRNDMFLVNYIFHVRSDILIAPEFRRYKTYQVSALPALADQVGIALGYLF